MKSKELWKFVLSFGVLTMGCVTQTERISYHRYYNPPEDESVLDELRREFGWQKPPPWVREEPLYKRAARGVKETVAGWFQKDDSTGSIPSGRQALQEFRRTQNEAIQRLQQQNIERDSQTDESSELTNNSLTPDAGRAPTEE
jgi:hypothetical protein